MSVDAPPAGAGFDLKATRNICDAFDRALTLLQQRNSGFADPERSSATRTVLARRIIEMAGAGMTEVTELCDDALRYLEEHAPFSLPTGAG
jgi:hypothetical protein